MHQVCVNLWSLNKQAMWCADFGKTMAPTHSKGKGKAKVTEEDDDEEDKATQTLWEELENFIVPAIVLSYVQFSNKESVALVLLLMEYYEGDMGLLRGAKILGERKGKLTLVAPVMQVLVLEKNSVHFLTLF
ncbi:hypothetical protein C0995_003811 [Termitomyces sp. Mi166|nr:hypothetical protein C0995_003811 [Termitomyces sp. Mi166\